MKRIGLFCIVALALCVLTGSAFAQLVGGTTYPINGTEAPPATFATISSAVTYLNTVGVSGAGDIVLELQTGYTGAEAAPISINAYTGADASRPVVIRPALGFTVTTTVAGTAAPNQYAIRLNGCSHVTLDGRGGGVGSARDWSVYCTGSGTSGLGQMAVKTDNTSASMTNISIRYLNMQAEAGNTTGAVYQITGVAGFTISNITIENNFITSTAAAAASTRGYGVTLAVASNVGNTGIVFRNNEITQFYARGINITGGFPGIEISGNVIHHAAAVTQPTTAEAHGIYYSTTTSPGTKIFGNFIYDIQMTNGTTAFNGIYLFNGNTAGARNQVYNNRIAVGPGIASTAYPIYGIRDNAVTGALFDIFYNSVFISGSPAAGASNSAAFRKEVSNNIDLKNNVFFNARSNGGTATGVHWAISTNNTAFTAINNNDYFANGTGGILGTTTGVAAGNQVTLAAWKAAMTADAASISQNPNYVNEGSSPPDLHINTGIATQLESGGTPIASVTTDFEGDARNATAPDIGGDEFAGILLDLSGPGISYTALTNTYLITSPRLFTPVTITDASGVDTTAGTRTRCYFKKIGDANLLGATNDATTDGWKYVEADGAGNSPFTFSIDYTLLYGGTGVAVFDTVQYFVVAQDLAGTPNVGINNGTFAAAPTSAALTAAEFPIGGSIRSYVITQPPLNGDYTVGLTKFNQASGRSISVQVLTRTVTKTIDFVAVQTTEYDKNGQPIEQPKQQTVTIDEPYQVLMENGRPYTGPISVNAKDGSKGVYPTITAAIADINTRGIDGATRLLLNDAAYNEAGAMTIDITNSYTPTVTNTITIQPNTGVTATVSVNSTSPVLIIAEPYVTIDGAADGGSGTSRDLTLVNNGAGASSGITFTSGASNVTVKNVIGYTSATTVGYGLIWSTRSFNGLAQNNQVYRTVIGIQAQSGSNGFTATGNLIGSSAALDKIQNSGMVALDCTTFVFTGNTISGVSRPSTSSCAGIVIGNAAQTGTIAGNAISDVKHTGVGASAYAAYGIRLASSVVAANVSAYNNYITDILGDGDDGASWSPQGIMISAGGGYSLYYNSVNMFGNINGGATPITSGIYVAAAPVNLDIRDNIFANRQTCTSGTGKCYGIYSAAPNTAYASINYNDYYATGANGVLGYLAADRADIAAWQAATGQDGNSLGSAPQYVANSDLRPLMGSPVLGAGTTIAGITTDFLSVTRDAVNPSIGAYEEGVDITPPTASVVSPAFGATNVALNAPVIVAFSEPMNTGSINGYATPTDPFGLSWNAAGDTLTMTPGSQYSYNSVYNVIATAATDLAGNNLVPLPCTLAQFTTIANQGPSITMTLQPGDTYDGTGPFMVQAVITDPAKQGISSATIYYSLNGLAWNNSAGVPTTADTFNFGITGGLANGTLVSYYLLADDDQGDTTYSPANAPVGVYQFRILDPLPPTALNAQGLDMAVSLSWAPPVQNLNYANAANWIFNVPSGFIATTRFTPMHYPCRLEQAVSEWYDGGSGIDSVIVHIYADDGTGMPDEGAELVTPFAIMPLDYPSATVVDLTPFNIVMASGDFHIGYELRTDGAPRYLSDNNAPSVIRSLYKWTDGFWYGDLGYNWNQAAVVSYSSYTKGLALKSSHLRKGQKPNYATGNGQNLKPETIGTKLAVQYPKLTGALAMAKNLQNYEVFRGDVTGGPYTLIGTSGTPTYLDITDANGTPYYYVVRAEYVTPDTFSANSNEASATPAALPILLVDDDGSEVEGDTDVRQYYTDALDIAGQSGNYTIFNSTFNGEGPDSVWLQGRAHVIWFTGEAYGDGGDSTLTPANEAALASYLNQGGKLFLSGMDYIYDRYGLGSDAPYKFTAGEFPYDYLGVDSVNQDFQSPSTTPFNVTGAGLALTDGMAFTVATTPLGWLYPDNLTKLPAAMDVFDVTAKVGEKPAVQYSNGTFRTVFFAMPFENLVDAAAPSTKGELMARILSWLTTGVEGRPTADLTKPAVYSLAANYPNPVRGGTTVKFGLPKAGRVSIAVYNVMGQKVKTLVDGAMGAGYHTVSWNGRNQSGQAVSAGVYLYKMQADNFSSAKKLVVVR